VRVPRKKIPRRLTSNARKLDGRLGAASKGRERTNVTAQFDRYNQTYDEILNSAIAFSGLNVDFFTRAKAQYLTRIMTDRFGDPSRLDLLDVGCGTGNLHPLLAQGVRSIQGVDVSSECLATARERNPRIDYRLYEGNTLPFGDAAFDVVFTICVMHHVPPNDWLPFARELRRVVKPGGIALVFEHNPYNPLTRYVVSSCEFDTDAVLLTGGTAKRILGEAGFSDVTIRNILTIPAANRAILKVDRLFGWLPFGAQYYALGVA
jgi:2-polyprenyl-3-methyl-5-hydroxy-6-metoxy-1,4-benzoquinol methylase